jgi:glycosyltransferase involved in cell wall biosynthesis
MKMDRYKVALIADWYLPRIGGLELHLRDLARELNARGHEAHIICSTPGPPQNDGIRVHRLDVPLMPGLRFIRSPRALVPLERILRQESFDIIHCQNAISPLCIGGLYLADKLGVPSVFTEQSVLRGAAVTLFRSIDRFYPWTRWATILTGVSSFVAEDIRQISGRDDVYVLHNGVNPQDWAVRGARAERRDRLRVTSVLRFTKRKRPMDIIRAIPLIHAQLPASVRPLFTLVGDGPERPKVEREARRLGVYEHVAFTGFRSGHEVREILSNSDVFVLPSIKEAHPRAVLEALSAGLPVVARTPNGVSDSVDHGREGFLARSLEELAGYIAQLAGDDALRARMAENAGKRLDRFSWDRVIPRHIELYRLASQRCRQPVAQPEPKLAMTAGSK